jgi:hypothetical protein
MTTKRAIVLGSMLLVSGACGSAPPSTPGPVDAAAPDVPPDAAPLPPQTTRLRIVNRCDAPIWISHSDNVVDDADVALAPGALRDYDIPDAGLPSARFWPRVGCDATGHGCDTGDVGQPPIDSKFEVTFAPLGGGAESFYNLSLVDGYTLPFAVRPVGAGAGVGNCSASDCSMMSLDDCPGHEDLGGGAFPAYDDVDLRVTNEAGATVACLAPCKAWNYPPPVGLGNPEADDPGLHLCCPTPIDPSTGNCTPDNGCMTPDACRDASDPVSVVHTGYVAVVHAGCPTAYAYSYDDAAGLHQCPAETGFEVTFCR